MAWILDSSAIVKRYINESGTGWVRSLTDPAAGNDIYVATITEVEVVSAFVRRHSGGGISTATAKAAISQLQYDFDNQYQTVELNEAVVLRAVTVVQAHALRAYDGLQLAVALELNAERSAIGLPALTFVSSDHDLNAAAAGEGLPVEDPNAHP